MLRVFEFGEVEIIFTIWTMIFHTICYKDNMLIRQVFPFFLSVDGCCDIIF